MVEERTLFDVDTNRWTVDKYLDDLQRRYGGIDGVLLWPVYPNVGIHQRCVRAVRWIRSSARGLGCRACACRGQPVPVDANGDHRLPRDVRDVVVMFGN
jgi:hypothetical protein